MIIDLKEGINNKDSVVDINVKLANDVKNIIMN